MHKIRKGDIAVNYVISRLLEFEDLIISKPVTENSRYDIIIDNGQKLVKVQVKSAWWDEREKCYKANLYSVNRIGKGNKYEKKIYNKNEVDFIIVYNIDKRDFFVFPVGEISVKEARLKELSKFAPSGSVNFMKYYNDFDSIIRLK